MSMHTPAAIRTSPRLFASRVSGGTAAAVASMRILVGAFFVLASLPKFPFGPMHEYEMSEFVRFGFPDSEALVLMVGVAEFLGGLALILGALTRPAAAGLAVVMIGAIATAGVRVGGPFHLGVAPTLLVILLGLVWIGSGKVSVDQSFARARAASA
jgi:putative oxidoreductase